MALDVLRAYCIVQALWGKGVREQEELPTGGQRGTMRTRCVAVDHSILRAVIHA